MFSLSRAKFCVIVVAMAMSAALAAMNAGIADAADSAPVFVNVPGTQETPSPTPTGTVEPTATVSPTPTGSVVPEPTTPGGGGDPAPVVSKLPDTGTSGATSATSLALLSTLAVGLVLVTGALAGSARRNG